MVLSALATLAHPFAFAAKAAKLIGSRRTGATVDTAQWTPELLRQLEWRRFEELCAAYFEALGFRISLAVAGGGVNLYEQGSERAAMLLQCKPWNAYRVGIKPVVGLRGAMQSEKVGEGVLVTSGKFTQEARDYAGKEKIRLIDGAELLGSIAALLPEKTLALLKFATQGDFSTPTCPSCAIKMVPRKSTRHGRTFWGCRNYPQCKQTFFGTV